jgi:flagellar basal-body rod modification protein FlgD
MSQIPSLLNKSTADQPFGEHNTLNNLDLDSFLKLMITELQNQDPLNPMDNTQMLEQINQIRQIGSTDKLTGTLESVLLGQNIASASGLIGADVDAISDTNEKVSGIVNRVTIADGKPQLELDLQSQGTPELGNGDLTPGDYSYRVVWQTANGPQGIELSGEDAISTQSDTGNPYNAIQLRNLPITDGPKQVFRTNNTGTGDYRLVTTITDGTKSTYLDTMADGDRSETRQTEAFYSDPKYRIRNFKVNLSNVSAIRRPE